jgi:hypothetical protein
MVNAPGQTLWLRIRLIGVATKARQPVEGLDQALITPDKISQVQEDFQQ